MKHIVIVDIAPGERTQLIELAEAPGTPPRVKRRALILLLANERRTLKNAENGRRLTNHRIAGQVGSCADTVRNTLQRFSEAGLNAAVYDKPFVRKVSPEAQQVLLDLVESKPPRGLPRWTLELLAEELRALQIVESISDTGVWDILHKRGIRLERNGAFTHDDSHRD